MEHESGSRSHHTSTHVQGKEGRLNYAYCQAPQYDSADVCENLHRFVPGVVPDGEDIKCGQTQSRRTFELNVIIESYVPDLKNHLIFEFSNTAAHALRWWQR